MKDHNQLDKNGNICKNNYRYVKLNYEKIANAVGINTNRSDWDEVAVEQAREEYYHNTY